MDLPQLRSRYEQHYAALTNSHEATKAAHLAVGGDFVAVGALEYYALKAHGLRPDHLVVDIGCGTGRLALQLAERGHERYAGFDIIASAVSYAREACGRPEWEFGVTDGLRIPFLDSVADFACFFSVFTHVAHEHTYLYLEEARRLLRPGGLVVFTFLEFGISSHWVQFESAVRNFGLNREPIVFLDRDAIVRFAQQLGYEVLALVDGDKPTFPIDEEIISAGDVVMKGRGYLGQSLGVLRKL